ncbi:MAG: hypothetical protein WC044_12845 [Crocinitomicaceae bacterium]
MKKYLLFTAFLTVLSFGSKAQTAADLLSKSDVKISWLGIDFSHVKLIGSFSQFQEAGATGPQLIRDKYFPGWNQLILNEPKYDVAGMVRKEKVEMNIEPITKINAKADLGTLEGEETPNYTKEDIQRFIKKYNFGEKEGIGMLFIAESLNKTAETARYHFVAINMKTNEILLYDVFNTVPGGFGLRNFWAKSYFGVIEAIKDKKYKAWKKELGIK